MAASGPIIIARWRRKSCRRILQVERLNRLPVTLDPFKSQDCGSTQGGSFVR